MLQQTSQVTIKIIVIKQNKVENGLYCQAYCNKIRRHIQQRINTSPSPREPYPRLHGGGVKELLRRNSFTLKSKRKECNAN